MNGAGGGTGGVDNDTLRKSITNFISQDEQL
jgi:hypothetical protein